MQHDADLTLYLMSFCTFLFYFLLIMILYSVHKVHPDIAKSAISFPLLFGTHSFFSLPQVHQTIKNDCTGGTCDCDWFFRAVGCHHQPHDLSCHCHLLAWLFSRFCVLQDSNFVSVSHHTMTIKKKLLWRVQRCATHMNELSQVGGAVDWIGIEETCDGGFIIDIENMTTNSKSMAAESAQLMECESLICV